MRLSISILLLVLTVSLSGQQSCFENIGDFSFHGNDVKTHYANAAIIFAGSDLDVSIFPYHNAAEEWKHIRGVTSLLLAAKQANGPVIDAAAQFPVLHFTDFCPGPLTADGSTAGEDCSRWNRKWQVFRDEILHHIEDYADDAFVNEPILNIFGWPGNGNPYFEQINGFPLPDSPQGFAPFFDADGDGIYEPQFGEYPMVEGVDEIPSQIAWAVANDYCGDLFDDVTSYFGDMNAEVQLTLFSFYCDDNPILNRTVFNRWKIINKHSTSWDSLFMGAFLDWDFECLAGRDEGAGTYPQGQSVFHYLRSIPNPMGTPCDTLLPDTIKKTLISTGFLNHELHKSNVLGLPCTPPPFLKQPFKFLDGTTTSGHLTHGEDGCNPDAPPAQFAFDGNPADPNAWSMASANLPFSDYEILPSVFLGTVLPGEAVTIDMFTAFHRESGADFSQNVQLMYQEIDQIRSQYQAGISTACSRLDCTGDCVWPGDHNGDSIVNHCDLFPLAVHLNQTGAKRSESPFWHASQAQTWNGQQANGKDLKHADGDGNGRIEIEDFKISENHYRFTLPGQLPSPIVYQAGPELYFTIIGAGMQVDPNHLKAGQTFVIKVWLDAPEELYGLAFELEYDTAYLKPPYAYNTGLGNYPNYTASWSSEYRVENNRYVIDRCEVRTHPDSTLHDGISLAFFTGTLDDYPDVLPSAKTLVRLRNIKGIRNDGTEITLGATDLELHFDDIMTATGEKATAPTVAIYPNPAKEFVEVILPEHTAGPLQIQIIDQLGRAVYTGDWRGENELHIPVSNIPNGLYWLRLNGQMTGKFCVMH
ncbi:MAG: hypothetical protein Kow0027_22560 [Saprospiraceae bacterium]